MLSSPRNPEFGKLLSRIAFALDIPDHVYEDATLKYEDVGDWLGAEDSDLAPYKPSIYVQGSFRLGTVVRPIKEEDEYDIDLVCHLEIKKEETTQSDLKDMVGGRLRKREDLGKMLQPSRRCWTLEYPPERDLPRFHMDVVNSTSKCTTQSLTEHFVGRLVVEALPRSIIQAFHHQRNLFL